jgi:hypothetical protein
MTKVRTPCSSPRLKKLPKQLCTWLKALDNDQETIVWDQATWSALDIHVEDIKKAAVNHTKPALSEAQTIHRPRQVSITGGLQH